MKDKLKEVYPIIFLTIVVLLSMTLLTFTDNITNDLIEENKTEEIKAMLVVQFPEMEDYEFDDEIEVYFIKNNNETIGYAFMAIGTGYGGDIEILVGLDENETTIMDSENKIKTISIISQTETPGLGTKITETDFLNQFEGIDVNEVELVRDGGEIDAITSATISSSAVVEIVKETSIDKIELIKEKLEAS